MYRAYKVEIKPTIEQRKKIAQTMGVCRYIYNLFIAVNKERYHQGSQYMTGYDFSKWLNHEWRNANPDKSWVRDVPSKAVKQSIMNADEAYRKYMKGKAGFPKYKRRNGRPVGIYLPRNNNTDLEIQRHRAKIPTLGWVRLKEYGYIPIGHAKSVTITRQAGRYFASFLIEEKAPVKPALTGEGIGIDLGVKSFAILSDGRTYPNINKSKRVRKLTRRLKREQRKFTRKIRHKRKEETATNKARSNLDKQRQKVQRVYMRLCNIRTDYVKKVIADIVKTLPVYITIEDLNIQGMMKNRHLSKAIAESQLYYFREILTLKCANLGIELRVVNRFYPSSKLCSKCGAKKKYLGLKERVYRCEHCGIEIDRDYNASVNLKNSAVYKTV